MKIGFDVKMIRKGRTGIGEYAYNLVKSLSELFPDDIHKYYAYHGLSPSRSKTLDIPKNKLINLPSIPYSDAFYHFMWRFLKYPKVESFVGDVDIVHSLSFNLPATKHAKKIITIHDLVYLLRPKTMTGARKVYLKNCIPHSARNADAILAVSENTKKDIIKYLGVDKDKVFVTYNGINHDVFKPIKDTEKIDTIKNKFQIRKKYIYHLGTIEPRKNIDVLLKAYRSVKEKLNNEFILVLSGRIGWKVNEFMKQLNDLIDKGDVIYTGYITNEEKAALYNGAEVFIIPSQYEGFGIPLIEAMACECPVITTDSSSLPEVVGEAGFITKVNDSDSLSEGILKVLTKVELRESMKKKSLIQASQFSWEKTAIKTRNIYEKILGK